MTVPAALSVVLSLAIGYLCGALPFGLWIGRLARGVDIRTMGSGNLGATNVYRSLGWRLGMVTLLLDVAKGALPVAILPRSGIGAVFPGGPGWCAVAVGLAAVAGHVWTFLAGFRGGKGVATTVGVLLALSPLGFGAFVLVFFLVLGITRFVSLGSILGAAAFAVTLALTGDGAADPRTWLGVALALLVLARHRENLRRLARGEERRFSFRGGAR